MFLWVFYFGALALATLVLLYLTRGYYAVSSSISSNEITDKSSQYNYYCEAGLCKTGVTHIGCINKGHFGHKCTKDAHVVQLDDYRKRLILHMHNQHRSTIAAGRTPGYPPAVRMGALQWDDELAHLALLNAMSCEIEHDKVSDLTN
jgi:Cysteine-rich secretory protein family